MSGKTGRDKGGTRSTGSGKSSETRGRGKKGKCGGRPELVRSNDLWTRDCPKMDDGKKRNLGAYAYGAWTCGNPDNSRDEKCSSDLFQEDSLRGAAVSPVQDDDECEVHAAFLVESEGFGVLDCGATTSFGSAEGAEALFSKNHENDTRIPEADLFGGRSFDFGDGAFIKGYFPVQTRPK